MGESWPAVSLHHANEPLSSSFLSTFALTGRAWTLVFTIEGLCRTALPAAFATTTRLDDIEEPEIRAQMLEESNTEKGVTTLAVAEDKLDWREALKIPPK